MSYSQETNRVFNTNTKRFYFIEFLRTNTMCEQKNEDYGIVYALINEAMPGLVKIGMTSRLEITQRMKELYNSTGVPLPFVSYGLTSLVSLYIGIGYVLNVGLQPKKYQ